MTDNRDLALVESLVREGMSETQIASYLSERSARPSLWSRLVGRLSL
jgi:hypothetical protein